MINNLGGTISLLSFFLSLLEIWWCWSGRDQDGYSEPQAILIGARVSQRDAQ